MILSLLIGIVKHSQSTQSNKFAISLQYIEKEVRKGVHFFASRKTSKFLLILLICIIVFDGSGQTCPKYSKYFYCDAKYSDTLQVSNHVCCCLFFSQFHYIPLFLLYFCYYHTRHIGLPSYRGPYKITVVCLCICLSVRPSVCDFDIFLRYGSLVFSDIMHNDR